jgi:hypothetical protein
LFLVVLSACGLDCVVANPIEFNPDENIPPCISSQPEAEFPLNEIGRINLDDPTPTPEMPLQVLILDANRGQTLQYRIFLDSGPPPPSEIPVLSGEIPSDGFLERPRTFLIPYELLAPGICHKIELVVAGAFAGFVEPRRPVEPGDVHEVVWWVEVIDAENPAIVRACR